MLAALLVPTAEAILRATRKLRELDKDELEKLHRRYKGLIKWITKSKKVNEVFSQELLDQIEKKDIVALRDLLFIDDEEAMILILIAANI